MYNNTSSSSARQSLGNTIWDHSTINFAWKLLLHSAVIWFSERHYYETAKPVRSLILCSFWAQFDQQLVPGFSRKRKSRQSVVLQNTLPGHRNQLDQPKQPPALHQSLSTAPRIPPCHESNIETDPYQTPLVFLALISSGSSRAVPIVRTNVANLQMLHPYSLTSLYCNSKFTADTKTYPTMRQLDLHNYPFNHASHLGYSSFIDSHPITLLYNTYLITIEVYLSVPLYK